MPHVLLLVASALLSAWMGPGSYVSLVICKAHLWWLHWAAGLLFAQYVSCSLSCKEGGEVAVSHIRATSGPRACALAWAPHRPMDPGARAACLLSRETAEAGADRRGARLR